MALRQALALAKRGTEVVLIGQGSLPHGGSGPNPLFVEAGVGRTIASASQAGYYFKVLALSVFAGLRGVSFLRRHPSVEVVHCHHSAIVGIFRALGPRRPLVLTVHDNPFRRTDPASGPLERSIRVMNNRLFEQLGVGLADSVVAVSPEVASRLQDWGVPPQKLTEIWPTAADRSLSPDLGTSEEATQDAIPRSRFVLSIGDLTGRKRMDLLVRALRDVPDDVHLVIVGRGPRRPELDALVSALGLRGRVTVLEYVSDATMFALQSRASLGVLVSEREGLPTSLIEAVSVGTPALYVTTRPVTVPNADPYLVHRVSSDPAEIARAIRTSCERLAQGTLARPQVMQWAERNFPSSDSVARVLQGVYGSLAVGHCPHDAPSGQG